MDYASDQLKTASTSPKPFFPSCWRQIWTIVTVSSVTGPVVSNPRETVYSAAKAAWSAYSQLALELPARDHVMRSRPVDETASSTEHEMSRVKILHGPAPAALKSRGRYFAFRTESASYITGQLISLTAAIPSRSTKGPPALYY